MNNSNAKYYFFNTDKFWNSSPFVKLSLSYCIGIIFHKSLGINLPNLVIYAIIGALFILSFQANRRVYFFKNQNFIAGFYIFLALFFVGFLNAKIYDPCSYSQKFFIQHSNFSYLSGIITKSVTDEPFSRYEIQITGGKHDTQKRWETAAANIVMLRKGDKPLRPGDKIVFRNKVKEIQPPASRFDINFKAFYENQGILFQQFSSATDPLYVYDSARFSLHRLAFSINRALKTKLRSALSDKSYSIASALLLGDKTALTEDTKTTFSKSGIMHILAVSGLHVGILFLLVQHIFSFLKLYKRGKIYFLIVSLLVLWTFALVTGLSNSVVRATLMFSLFSLGPVLNRRTFGHNTTACAALIILVFNPNALYEISFQLSFAAVFSILFFYEDLYRLIEPKFILPDKIWQIVSVSLAAQIGTFPLTVYYFHHFQPGFLVFNVLAIPFAFVTLVGGIMFLIVSFVPVLSDFVGFLLDQIISRGADVFETLLKYAPEMGYLNFSGVQVVICYLIIFVAAAFLVRKKLAYLATVVVLIFVFNGIFIHKKVEISRQNELLITSSKEGYIVDWVNGQDYFTIENSAAEGSDLETEAQRKRDILGAKNLYEPVTHFNNENYELIVHRGKSLFVLNNSDLFLSPSIHFDYIVLNLAPNSQRIEYYRQFADNILCTQSY